MEEITPELQESLKKVAQEYCAKERAKEEHKKSPMAVASLPLGILSIVFCLVWYLTIALGTLAIIFGAKGTKKTGSKLARAGMICGIIGLSICVAVYGIATLIILFG